jgi:hypothetical protein
MKSCPKCNRTYPDEGQKFCTFDGGLLIAPQTFDPNVTIRATSVDLSLPSEKATSRELPQPPPPDLNETMAASYAPTTTLPRNTGPTTGTPTTADFSRTPPPPPVTQSAPVPISAPLAPQAQEPPTATTIPSVQPSTPLGAVEKKKSKLPLIVVSVVLLLLLLGGGLVGLAIFFRPQIEEALGRNRPAETPTPIVQTNTNTNASATPEVSPGDKTNANSDTFKPPADAIHFVSSKSNLDGKLAEHYLDFSFYYPQAWKKDPKAGVPGASNFVLVERSLPTHFPLENFAVGWYTSTGTFIGDLRNYPERVEEYSSALARQFPEYRKVSEGPTKINSMQGYEFRWEGLSKGTEKGDVHLWGRVVFLPTGTEGDTAGATLTMFATSLADELKGVEDVGEKGQMPLILESFRFGSSR